jgi:hypothetical protein
MRRCPLLLVFLVVGLQSCGAAPQPDPQTIPLKGPVGEVNFLAMADWGQNTPHQRKVAEAMASYAKKMGNIQCALLGGDNFYLGLSGVDDPVWKNVFEDMYDAKRLNFPFFAALGNHDYQGNKAQIELDYARVHPKSRWKMPARWYRIDLSEEKAEGKTVAMILMLDSNKQVSSAEDWAAQLKWMDEQLASAPAGAWKICCAHHTLFSNGAHGDNGVLQVEWGALFKKHNVDMYICGHDHDLQHLEMPGWTQSFVLVGGGGGGVRPMRIDRRGPFSKSTYGFAHFQITPEKTTVRFLGEDGRVLHAFERNRAGSVTLLANTTSDKATTNPLRVIQGVDGKKGQGD